MYSRFRLQKLIRMIGVADLGDFQKKVDIVGIEKIVIDLLENRQFIDSISKGTNGTKAVTTRHNMLSEKLSSLVGEN